MGFNFRKSIKVGKGVRINVSKRGVGISGGVKGLRTSVGPSGKRVRATVPGTGLYYEKRLGSKKSNRTNSRVILNKNDATKQAIPDSNVNEVKKYEELINTISSVHKECIELINWTEVRDTPLPFIEGEDGPNTKEAFVSLENYKPSLRDKIFNRIEARKRILLECVEEAKNEDHHLLDRWKLQTDLAEKILNQSHKDYLKVLSDDRIFGTPLRLGSKVYGKLNESNELSIDFIVNSSDVLPLETKSLTKTGKVSTKKMAVGKARELHLHYVSSCAISIARNCFAALPVNRLYVHCYDSFENYATGHIEEDVVLSVLFTRDILDKVNFETIVPFETIQLFHHNIDFKKTRGFTFVNKLEEVRQN